MHIVSMAKFAIGLVFIVIALVFVPRALRERGFGKFRQLIALCVIAAIIFAARGLGLVDF
jgi:hypothetical protein